MKLQELKQQLETIESRRSTSNAEGLFHRIVPELRVSDIDREKAEVIQNFEPELTPEDVLELLEFASRSIDLSQYEDWNSLRTVSKKYVSDAWIQKMRLIFPRAEVWNTPETEEVYRQIRKTYAVTMGRVDERKKKSRLFSIGFPLGLVVLLGLGWLLLVAIG